MNIRKRRVEDEIRRILAEILIRDLPCNQHGLITVTRVECSNDLKIARIFLSVYHTDAQERQAGVHRIIENRSRIRGLLGNRLQLRFVPELIFVEDDTMVRVEKIERLIQSLHESESAE